MTIGSMYLLDPLGLAMEDKKKSNGKIMKSSETAFIYQKAETKAFCQNPSSNIRPNFWSLKYA